MTRVTNLDPTHGDPIHVDPTQEPTGSAPSAARAEHLVARRGRGWLRSLVAVPLLVAVLAACQGNSGISREDAATIKSQLEQVANRLDAVEDRLMDLSRSTADTPALLISEVRAATTDVGAAKSILADVSSQLESTVPDATDDLIPNATDDLLDQSTPSLDDDANDQTAPFGGE